MLEVLDQIQDDQVAKIRATLRESQQLLHVLDQSEVNTVARYRQVIDLHKAIQYACAGGKIFSDRYSKNHTRGSDQY